VKQYPSHPYRANQGYEKEQHFYLADFYLNY